MARIKARQDDDLCLWGCRPCIRIVRDVYETEIILLTITVSFAPFRLSLILLHSNSSFLTADREEKLNSIGFVWSVRGETGIDGPMEPASPVIPKEEDTKDVAAPMPAEVPVKEDNLNNAQV